MERFKVSKQIFLKCLFLMVLFISSCKSDGSRQSIVPSTSLDQLEKFINISGNPHSVKWNYLKVGGDVESSDSKIIAVLEYQEDREIAELKERYFSGPSINERISIKKEDILDWFPESVKDSFSEDESGLIPNFRAYPLGSIGKGVYKHGFIFVNDDKYLFVYAHTI